MMLLIAIPLAWTAVMAVIVSACCMAGAADRRSVALENEQLTLNRLPQTEAAREDAWRRLPDRGLAELAL